MTHDDDLDENASDAAGRYARKAADGLAGLIPLFGPVVAELFADAALPQDRIDRIVAKLRALSVQAGAAETRLTALEEQAAIMELVSAAVPQAGPAASPARKARVAQLLADGIEGSMRDAAFAAEVIRTLASLSEIQLIVLSSFHPRYANDPEWVTKHHAILGNPVGRAGRGLGSNTQAPDTETAKAQLVGRGLLSTEFIIESVWERNGDFIKVQGLSLSPFGLAALRELGLI